MKTIIKITVLIVGVAVVGFAAFLGYATITDYQPPQKSVVHEKDAAKKMLQAENFSLMIWNIGYAGLSSDMDFFYDGGIQVRPLKQTVQNNIEAIGRFIQSRSEIDFFLLQEVDLESKRSYETDEVALIALSHPGFYSFFAKNYDVSFVPVPVFDPLGKVKSGLMTLSRFEPFSVVRHSFPGNYKWPQGIFMLDRCFMAARYRLENGKTLLIVNTHNSAYDDGSLRKQQMVYLEKILADEYKKGSYVVVGGDWNQCPPGFVPAFEHNKMDNQMRMDIDKDFLPDWQWAYDGTTPTNRRLKTPYNEAKTLTTVIDFFLVSPNIEIKSVKGVRLNFEHADHQPVILKMALKTE